MISCKTLVLVRWSTHTSFCVWLAKLFIGFVLFANLAEANPKTAQDTIARFEVDFEQRAIWYSMTNFNESDSNQSFWIRWETGEKTSTTLSRLWTSTLSDRVVCYHPPGRDHSGNLYYVTEEGQNLCIENGNSYPTTPHTAFYLDQPHGPTRLSTAGESDWLALNVYRFEKKRWQLAVYHWKDLKSCIDNPLFKPFSPESANICSTPCGRDKCHLGRFYTVQSGPAEHLVREHFEADIGMHPDTKALRVVYQVGISEENSKTVDETLRLIEIPANEAPATKADYEKKRDLSERAYVDIGENDSQFKNGWKGQPRFSPDGKWLAYLASKEKHDESAEMELLVIPASGTMKEVADASTVNITSHINRPVTNFQWSCDSQCILFQVSSQGDRPLYQANLNLKTGEWVMPAIENPVATGVSTVTQFEASEDGLELFVLNSSLSTPPSIVRLQRIGPWDTGLFHCSAKTLMEQCQTIVTTPRDSDSVVAHKESVQPKDSSEHPVDYFVVRSNECSSSKLCPLVVRVHGGPNGVSDSAFDPITYGLAKSGYVVLLPNPTGSIGFGQPFTDAVKKQWGGAVVDDVIKVVNQALDLPYVDRDRVYGMGNSYGGYMMNYFLVDGQSEAKTQLKFHFNAIVTVNGVWDLRDFACSTDQPWFAFDQLGFAEGDDECKDYGKLIDFNPIDRAEHIQSIPTLVVYSLNDRRVRSEFQNKILFERLKESFEDTPDPLVLKGGHSLRDSERYSVLEHALKHFGTHQ